MAMPTPQMAGQTWARNLAAASERMKAGVAAVTVSPTAKAADAVDRQVLGVQAAATSGKTRRALLAVSLQDWQQAYVTKGIPRITGGANAAMPKMVAFMSEFLPFLASGQAQVQNMPKGGLENGIARMTAMARHTATFRRSGG